MLGKIFSHPFYHKIIISALQHLLNGKLINVCWVVTLARYIMRDKQATCAVPCMSLRHTYFHYPFCFSTVRFFGTFAPAEVWRASNLLGTMLFVAVTANQERELWRVHVQTEKRNQEMSRAADFIASHCSWPNGWCQCVFCPRDIHELPCVTLATILYIPVVHSHNLFSAQYS